MMKASTTLRPSDNVALILHRQGFNGCYKPVGMTCSTNGGKVRHFLPQARICASLSMGYVLVDKQDLKYFLIIYLHKIYITDSIKKTVRGITNHVILNHL